MTLLLFLILVASPSALDDGAPTAEAAAEPPALEFVDDASRIQFGRAWRLFAESDWTAAAEGFAQCRPGAAPSARPEIDRYLEACKGGPKADRLVALVGRGKYRPAYAGLAKLEKKYAATPLDATLIALRARIEQHLFHVVADFEKHPGDAKSEGDAQERVRKALGALSRTRINEDPRFVRSGLRSLRWSAGVQVGNIGTARIALPVSRITPLDGKLLADYRYLRLSIYTEASAQYALYLDTNEGTVIVVQGNEPQGQLRIHQFKSPRKGWLDLRIDLHRVPFAKRKIDPTQVQALSLRALSPDLPQPVYLDDIKLERP